MPNRHISAISVLLLAAVGSAPGAWAWEPTKSIEFIIPAGTGGGADQMARFTQGVTAKHSLIKQSVIPINKSGGAGAEGFLDVKASKGDSHKIIITLSNLFTTPLATGVPFNWKDLTPVAMLALDNFVLWVPADTAYMSPKDYLAAVKAAGPNKFKMGGTGAKQEDQIITVAIEKAAGVKFTYIPFKGGGAVATQLVGKHIDSSVNNPIEAVAHWSSGKLRPLCVFEKARMPYKNKVTATMSWNDIPTCREAGIPMDYLMLRGVFMPAGVSQEVVDFYIGFFRKVRGTAEWAKLMEDGAFNQSFMTGKEYAAWVAEAENLHRQLMTEAGFIGRK